MAVGFSPEASPLLHSDAPSRRQCDRVRETLNRCKRSSVENNVRQLTQERP